MSDGSRAIAIVLATVVGVFALATLAFWQVWMTIQPSQVTVQPSHANSAAPVVTVQLGS
jgi:hypothetical protein